MTQFDSISYPDGPTPDILYSWMMRGLEVGIEGPDTTTPYWTLTQESRFHDIWGQYHWAVPENHAILRAVYVE